ncbi:MAG: GNAT family N-acetyltransferase [candidate division Zixibacteria bacterium]|nr:GNAT family N-acetyltransferase [candidate division Zixibacteria bacterium]
MDILTRQLTIADFEQIRSVWDIAGLSYKPGGRESYDAMKKEMANPACAFFGLFSETRVLGVAIANFDGRRGWINRLAVDPDFRGIGLAGRLIRVCEDFLYSRGALVIAALIDEMNDPSTSAFQKEGFGCVPEIRYFSKYKTSES